MYNYGVFFNTQRITSSEAITHIEAILIEKLGYILIKTRHRPNITMSGFISKLKLHGFDDPPVQPKPLSSRV